MRNIILASLVLFTISCKAQNVSPSIEKDSLSGAVRFLENNNMTFSKTFKNNVENGLSIRIDPETNKVKYIYDSDNENPRGLVMNFYPNGNIKSIREADIDSEGQYIEFHNNSTLKELSYRVKGKTTGWVYKYDVDGKLESKKYYINGEPINDN